MQIVRVRLGFVPLLAFRGFDTSCISHCVGTDVSTSFTM